MLQSGFPKPINPIQTKEDEKMHNDNTNTPDNQNDVISDLESLSQKYGFQFNGSAYKSSSAENTTPAGSQTQQSVRPETKYSRPAGVPRIYYDESSAQTIKLIYDNDRPSGPEGRRVIYSEPETESIAEKRRRNRIAQKSEKGAVGFGSQPYVRHVASSDTAMSRDDGDKFTREYNEKKLSNTTSASASQQTANIPRTGPRLVASNPEAANKAPRFQHYEPTAGEKAAKFFKTFIPWKGDPAKEVIRKIIMNVSAILVIFCFGYFVDNYIQHKEHIDKKNEMVEMQTETPSDNLEARWEAIKLKYPDIEFPDGMNIKYAELYAKNQDLVGWLKVGNTNIDTPVVQHVEDREKDPAANDFYLKRDFYKQDNKYGNAYLDAFNTGSELDTNNIIYGHNMTDGLSFAQLEKYYTIDGFKESPIIQYSTLYHDYYFKVYAVFITNGYPSGDNGYLFDFTVTKFTGEENYKSFIEAIDERKLYDTGVGITPEDKLITLSTCSYEIKENQMGRLTVIGRLVRPGESTAVDFSHVKENPDPRYPQIWYDEHNMTNPYKNAFRWEPQ